MRGEAGVLHAVPAAPCGGGACSSAVKTSTPTHYELLGVDPDATPAEIKAAWRRVVHFAHPDKGAPAGLFRSLEIAYKVLSDDLQRSAYDRSLNPAGASRR